MLCTLWDLCLFLKEATTKPLSFVFLACLLVFCITESMIAMAEGVFRNVFASRKYLSFKVVTFIPDTGGWKVSQSSVLPGLLRSLPALLPWGKASPRLSRGGGHCCLRAATLLWCSARGWPGASVEPQLWAWASHCAGDLNGGFIPISAKTEGGAEWEAKELGVWKISSSCSWTLHVWFPATLKSCIYSYLLFMS